MMSIVAEAPGYLQVFSDGSVKRFAPEIASPSIESTNGYKSKDVVIDSSKKINARIFVPDDEQISQNQLPVLVYFHGGGFCIGSTTWLGYHLFLGDLSVTSNCIVLSVDYRLAPEHKLPVAYDDCYSSLQWLSNNGRSESWLEKADLTSVFLSGDSAGGNIVHQVAVKAIQDKTCGVTLKGLLPIHPYFGSQNRTDLEMMERSQRDVTMNDMFWKLSLPEGSGRDYYGCDFQNGDLLSADEWQQFPAVVVYVAGFDFLKERGVMYADFLLKKGVKAVKLVEAEYESHVYHVFNPESYATRLLQKQMSQFIHSFESVGNAIY